MGNIKIITGATGATQVHSEDDRANNRGTYDGDCIIASDGAIWSKHNDYNYYTVSNMQVTLVDSNTVRLSAGDMMIQGCHVRIPYGEHVDLTIDSGVTGQYRADCIVVHYTKDELGIEDCNLEVIKGQAQDTALTQIDINNISLAIESGDMYKGDTDVKVVICTLYIHDTTVDSPHMLIHGVTGLCALQECLNDIIIKRNDDVTRFKQFENMDSLVNSLKTIKDQQAPSSLSEAKGQLDTLIVVLIAMMQNLLAPLSESQASENILVSYEEVE